MQLTRFLEGNRSRLSAYSQDRLDRGGAMRVLDSKEPEDKELLADALFPRLGDHLSKTSVKHFEAVRRGLDRLGVEYDVDPLLVRGLDYYCHVMLLLGP